MKTIQAARLGVLILLILVGTFARAADTQYVEEVERWRQEFDADIRTSGWLALIGRVKVGEGTWTLGASPESGILLPAPSPLRVGTLIRRGKLFEFQPADGIEISIDDRAVTSRAELSTQQGAGKIKAGDLSLTVRLIAGDFYLNIEYPKNPASAEFKAQLGSVPIPRIES